MLIAPYVEYLAVLLTTSYDTSREDSPSHKSKGDNYQHMTVLKSKAENY
jgi:hypothetical protein